MYQFMQFIGILNIGRIHLNLIPIGKLNNVTNPNQPSVKMTRSYYNKFELRAKSAQQGGGGEETKDVAGGPVRGTCFFCEA